MATKKTEGKVRIENRMDASDPKNVIFQKAVAGRVKKFSADLGMMKVNGNKLATVIMVKEQNGKGCKGAGKCEGHRAVIQAGGGTSIDFAELLITFLVELDIPVELVLSALARATASKFIKGMAQAEIDRIATPAKKSK